MNRAQLDQSNATNILGPGKASKARLSNHNNNIADYVDGKTGKNFRITIPAGAAVTSLTDERFDGNAVLKIERTGGAAYFVDTEFTQAIDDTTHLPVDTIVMTNGYQLQASTTYFVTLE